MSDGALDAASLRGAVALAVSLGHADREAGALALEQLSASPDDAVSVAQVAFLLDLDEPTVESLARRAQSGQRVPEAETLETAPASLVGQVLDGFEILELLGEGGMGRVYRARQQAVHRDVALKVLAAHRVGDAENVRRFLREGRAAAALNHPHVVTCHGMGRVGDHLYVAMELLPGGDLEARTRKHGGRLPERRALAVVRDACEGLVALEAAGLVHRDIKPANIFLSADSRAKLGDLGLACSRLGDDRVTRTGLVVGTPVYMAPEQAEGTREPDVRADIYALGATLHRLVTGELPFSGSELAVLRRKLDAPPPDPRQARPDLSATTARLIMRAMARSPEDRPATARAFLGEIDDALRTLDQGAPAASRRRVALAAVAGVAVIAAAAALLWPRPGAEPVADPVAVERAPPAPGAITAQPAPEPVAAGEWRLIALRPGGGSFASEQDGSLVIAPGDEDWRRTGFFDGAQRSAPLRARFRVSAEAVRDAPPGVLAEQGFRQSGGFFHELGIRGEDREVDAGAQLQGFAFWVTLVTDASGAVHGLVRAIGPDKAAGQLAVGSPGVARLDDFSLPSAFATGPLDVELAVDEAGWRLALARDGREIRARDGRWAPSGLRLGDAPRGPLHLWAHAGNWGSGRGSGRLAAFVVQM